MTTAYHINSEDCMGNSQSYWRSEHTCSDGKLVLGHGVTEDQAKADATSKGEAHETFIRKSPMERLRVLVSGSLLDNDKCEAIRIIAQMLEGLDARNALQ